jgi:DNA-binding protein
MSSEPKVVFIGNKPIMNYVLTIIRSFSSPDVKEVVLKARGRSITTAVDVAEVTKRQFMKQLDVKDIVIGTEEIKLEGGGTRAVSTIEITLKREDS